jgi:O-antigen/teichoic acid export membrane protein
MSAPLSARLRGVLALSFAGSAGIQALNAVTGIVGARALGPHGRGELAALLLWPLAISSLGSLGLSDAIAFHAARRTAPARTLAGTAAALAAAQAIVLTAVTAALVPLVYGGFGAGVQSTALFFLPAVALNLLTLYPLALLNGRQRFGRAQAVRVLVVVGLAAGMSTLWAIGRLTVRSAVLVYLCSIAATAVLAVVLAVREGEGRFAISGRLARQLVGYGVKSHAVNVSSLLNERLDQLLISLFLAPAALGLYVAAVTLTSVTALVGASVSFVAVPLVARAAASEAREAAVRLVRLTLALAVGLTVPLLVFAPRVLELCFGSRFAPASEVARILLVGAVFLATSRTLGSVLQAVNRPLAAGVGETIAVAVTVVGLAVLLPTAGLTGAAVASVLAYAVGLAWNLRAAAAALGLPRLTLLRPAARQRVPLVAREGS